jgi:catalase (peroxidase I)
MGPACPFLSSSRRLGRRRRRSAAPTSVVARTARIRLAPQKDWEVNQPTELKEVLRTLETIQDEFNASQSGSKKVRWPT